MLLDLKSQASFSFIPFFFFFLKADREDGEPQHEDESSESDEEEEELENKKVSLFDESKFYLRVASAQNCHVLAQNRNEYENGSIREFQHQGRSLYFLKWVRSNIVSHPEYHLTVVCSNRSDNLSLHVAHFRMPS